MIDRMKIRHQLQQHEGPCNKPLIIDNDRLLELMAEADEVWLSSIWMPWTLPYIAESLQNIKTVNNNIVVFGTKLLTHYEAGIYMQPKHKWGNAEYRGNDRKAHIADLDAHLDVLMQTSEQAGVPYVDVHRLLCGEDSDSPCHAYDGSNVMSYDGVHLTRYGAQKLGALLLEKKPFLHERKN